MDSEHEKFKAELLPYAMAAFLIVACILLPFVALIGAWVVKFVFLIFAAISRTALWQTYTSLFPGF